MRRSFLISFAAIAAVSALACTAVLGDFTVSGSATGDGGAGDGAIGDGAGGGDGGDGSADAPPPLKPLNCAIAPQKVSFSYADLDGGASIGDSPQILVYSLTSGQFRIIVQGYDKLLYADFSNNESQPIHFKALPLTNSWVMSVARYPAGPQSPPGTAILVAARGAGTPPDIAIQIVRFDDSAPGPTAPLTLVDGSAGVLPTGLDSQSLGGTVEVVDAAMNDYLLAIKYRTAPNGPYTLAGAHIRGASAHPKVIDTNLPRTDDLAYAIAHNATNAWVILFPPSANGPPTGPMPLYKLNFADMSNVSVRQLAPPSGFYAPFAMTTSSSPGTVDIAFLEADLNQQVKLPVFHVGQIKMSDLDTFDPAKVMGPEVALAQLTFNKGVSSWQTFAAPAGDHFLSSSRPLNDGTPGVTFLWIDSSGRLRTSVAAMDGGSGWPTTLVGSIGVTLNGAPAASFAQVRFAWVEGQGGNVNPPIFSMGGTCLP